MKRPWIKFIFILIFAGFLVLADNPNKLEKIDTPVVGPVWNWIQDLKVHLGLDLQGGTQLDYEIDLREARSRNEDDNPENDVDIKELVEGVREVIEHRVNALGVSEPSIYLSSAGDEQHIVVELAGIKDIEEAKEKVGKVVQLEFKEQNTEIDPNLKEKVKKQAEELQKEIRTEKKDFQRVGEDEQTANPGKVRFSEGEFKFRDQLDSNIADLAFEAEAGTILSKVVETTTYSIGAGNSLTPTTDFNVIKVEEKREEERTIDTPKSIQSSHLLVAFQGAERASEEITRTEEEAQIRADEASQKIQSGELTFGEAVKEYSDEPGSEERDGKLDAPVKEGGSYDPDFTAGALALTEAGEISEVVKSKFGFHIIRAEEITPEKHETKIEPQVKVSRIAFSAAPDPWKKTNLDGRYFKRADVAYDQTTFRPYVAISFDSEGGELFEEITERNVGKPIAIFVGGEFISAPNVNEKISGGRAQITLGISDIQKALE
ncbi:MAG TPA: hypothetical protein ENI70_01355, partial [Candidatus Peregrinibacteria bacterium]|nr:hypothetical protein [Candidatus Peregrinibacteria bacterium]